MTGNRIIIGLLSLILLLLGIIFIMDLRKDPARIVDPIIPSPSPTPPITPTQAPIVSQVNIYLIALNDNGKLGPKIGCNDSVVALGRQITPTQAPLRAALNEMLSVKSQFTGQAALYNSLYQSTLKIDDVVINSAGKATIKLSGDLRLGGVCDSPRVEAQLTQTARQFQTVKEVEIFINNKPLKEALSQK